MMNDKISPNMLLMMKDEVVMKINFDTALFEVLNEQLVPWTIKGRIRKVPKFEDVKTHYDDVQRQRAIMVDSEAIVSFLASRVLPLSRDNAKKVYNLFRFEQSQDEYSKAKIALACRAVSLQDNYWVKLETDKETWKDVDLRTNKLNEIVAQVSLHGSSLSLQGSLATPELTGQGAYAKAWKREGDSLWLYKRGAKDPTESRIEVMVSNLLDNCSVDHLKYEAGDSKGVYCCKCKCMTTDEISILPAMDFSSYCNRHDKNFYDEIMKIDAENVYKMWIVDYLISNPDRHGMNWGFFYKADTMEILGCHPLYDHNNSFDTEYMQDENTRYLFNDKMSMREAAEYAMQKVDFHFYREFTREDFITERQYQTFTHRANQIGVKVIPKEISLETCEVFSNNSRRDYEDEIR